MKVTVTMSAVWLNLATIFCLSCTALSATESSGVLWRDFGGDVTFQCRCPEPDQEYLEVKKGLSEETLLLFKENHTGKTTIATNFTGRLQVYGGFPQIDILIKNLTLEDTGPYWCLYKRYDQTSHKHIITKVAGSLLVVVKGKDDISRTEPCDTSKYNLVMLSVVISAGVLLSIIMGILIWLIKTKPANTTGKARRVPNNDVYEDMRGALRP